MGCCFGCFWTEEDNNGILSTDGLSNKCSQEIVVQHTSNNIRGRGRSIIGGAHIHIFVFTDCKHNRFQKKLMMHNTNI